jgi:hypothetical protein
VALVDYFEIEPEMDGLVNFDKIAPVDFPGIQFNAHLRFAGLAIGTLFVGQFSYLTGQRTYISQRLGGRPSVPFRLREGGNHSGKNLRHVFGRVDTADQGAALYPGSSSVAMRFSNRQRRLGFELLAAQLNTPRRVEVLVRFYDEEGRWMRQTPITLSQPGFYGFETVDEMFAIKGVTLEGLNGSRYAIDNIIFDTPMLIGWADP